MKALVRYEDADNGDVYSGWLTSMGGQIIEVTATDSEDIFTTINGTTFFKDWLIFDPKEIDYYKLTH